MSFEITPMKISHFSHSLKIKIGVWNQFIAKINQLGVLILRWPKNWLIQPKNWFIFAIAKKMARMRSDPAPFGSKVKHLTYCTNLSDINGYILCCTWISNFNFDSFQKPIFHQLNWRIYAIFYFECWWWRQPWVKSHISTTKLLFNLKTFFPSSIHSINCYQVRQGKRYQVYIAPPFVLFWFYRQRHLLRIWPSGSLSVHKLFHAQLYKLLYNPVTVVSKTVQSASTDKASLCY